MAVAAAPAEVGFSAEFVALIFAFLFLWLAIVVLDGVRAPTVNLAGAVPLVGGALRGAVDAAFNAARGWLYAYLSQSLVAYATLLDWLNTLWTASADILLEGAAAYVWAIFRLRTVIIPAYAAEARDWAAGQVFAAVAALGGRIVVAEALARDLFAAAESAL